MKTLVLDSMFVFLFYMALTTIIGVALVRLLKTDQPLDGARRGVSWFAAAPVIGMAAIVVFSVTMLYLRASMAAVMVAVVLAALASLVYVVLVFNRRQAASVLAVLGPLVVLSLLVYGVYLSPLVATGRPAVTGYNVANDSVPHSVVSEYLKNNGLTRPKTITDSFDQSAERQLFQANYPIGFHAALGLVAKVVSSPVFDFYNPLLAFFSALCVFVAYLFLSLFGARRIPALIGAAIAPLAYLMLGYYVQAFASQVAALCFIYLSVILLYFWMRRESRPGLAVLTAVAITAAYMVYSYVALLWLGLIGAGLAVVFFVQADDRMANAIGQIKRILVLAGFALVLNLTAIASSAEFLRRLAGEVRSGAGAMGNLPGTFVSPITLFGVWFGPDFRYPVPPGLYTYASYGLAAGAIVLLVVGLAAIWRSKSYLAYVMLAAWCVPAIALRVMNQPYSQGKILYLGSLAFSILIVYGAITILDIAWTTAKKAGIWRYIAGAAGLGLVLAVAAGAAASDFNALRGASPTPDGKFADLYRFNQRYADSGRVTLFLDQEDWGTYFLRALNISSPQDQAYPGRKVALKSGHDRYSISDFGGLNYKDTRPFNLVIVGRRNDLTLMPPEFALDYRDRYYSVYKRQTKADSNVLIRTSYLSEDNGLSCTTIEPGEASSLKPKPGSGAVLLALYKDGSIVSEAETWNLKGSSWFIWPANKDYIVNTGDAGGTAASKLKVPAATKYNVYVTGIPNNGLSVAVDGAEVGRAKREGELADVIYIGQVALKAGVHEVSLINTGSGNVDYISKVTLVPARDLAEQIQISIGGDVKTADVDWHPGYLQFPLTEGVPTELNIKNTTVYPLRLEWVEELRKLYEPGLLLDREKAATIRSKK